MAEANPDEPSPEVLKSCPLDSKFCLNWNADIRDKFRDSSSNLEKAELLRRLAGDADLRAAAFESHGQHEKALVARFMSHLTLQLTAKQLVIYVSRWS